MMMFRLDFVSSGIKSITSPQSSIGKLNRLNRLMIDQILILKRHFVIGDVVIFNYKGGKMDQYFEKLIERSRNFKKSLTNIINVEHYDNKNTITEEIMHLENLNKYLDSKIKLADIELLNNNTIKQIYADRNKNANYNQELVEKLLHKNIYKNSIELLEVTDTFEMLSNNDSNNPEVQNFKKHVYNQLNTLANINDALLNITEEKNKIIEEITNIKTEIMEKRNQYKDKLASDSAKAAGKISDEYKNNLSALQTKINKINFMRVITIQLIIGLDIFHDDDKVIEIFESLRYPCTLKSLQEASIE